MYVSLQANLRRGADNTYMIKQSLKFFQQLYVSTFHIKMVRKYFISHL